LEFFINDHIQCSQSNEFEEESEFQK